MKTNPKFETRNSKKGFTLIELLIYTAVFTIVLTVAVSLFFQTRTIQSQIVQEQEVDRNGRIAFLEMTQTIRAATNVSSPALGVSASNLYLNSNGIHYFVNGSAILQKTEGGQTNDVTSNKVSIENITFTTRGEVLEKPTVTVSFDVRANTRVYGQTDYTKKTFRTTVQLR